MFASDIHGSESCCRMMKERYEQEKAGKLILLGDLLYHGARNDLPEGYHPKGVTAILNEMKEELLCVRGNCESEVDQMVLEFPVMAEYALLSADGLTMFLTHGHRYHPGALPPLKRGEILINGHTHIPAAQMCGEVLYLNPGSVTMPKGGFPRTYMIYEDGYFSVRRMDGTELMGYRARE